MDIPKENGDVTKESSTTEAVNTGNDFNESVPLNLDGTDDSKTVSVTQFADDNSAVAKTGASNIPESFARIPGLSFINNSFFTNLLRSKEQQEEVPVSHYESTRADKMRSRKLYRQMNKQNEVILSEQINGYRGDKSIADIVEYIEGVKSTGKKKPKKAAEKKVDNGSETKETNKNKSVNFKSKEKRTKSKVNESVKITDKSTDKSVSKNTNDISDPPEKRRIKNVKNHTESNGDILKDNKSKSSKIDKLEISKTSVNTGEHDDVKSKSKTENKTSKQNKLKCDGANCSELKSDEKRKVPEEKRNVSNVKKNKTDQNKENAVKSDDQAHRNAKTKKK